MREGLLPRGVAAKAQGAARERGRRPEVPGVRGSGAARKERAQVLYEEKKLSP